jgi:hypothetical protein
MARYDYTKGHQVAPHMGSYLPVAVEIETTGPLAGYDNLINLKLLPLDGRFKPSTQFYPFNLDILPKRPGNIDAASLSKSRKKRLSQVLKSGYAPDEALNTFYAWFDNHRLLSESRLIPVAWHWGKVYPFLLDFFHPVMDHFFAKEAYRDLGAEVHFLQDIAFFNRQSLPLSHNIVRDEKLLRTFECGITDPSNTYAGCMDIAKMASALSALRILGKMDFVVQ